MPTSFEDVATQLRNWAEREGRLDSPEGNISYRQHLLHVRKSFAKQGLSQEALAAKFPELEPVPIDPEFQHLTTTFQRLCMGRAEGFSGPQSFSFTELKAYFDLMGETPSPLEVEYLKLMDITYLNTLHKHKPKDPK